jgi:hypothetical protein
MRHQQYRESLFDRLRVWKTGHPEGTLSEAKKFIRSSVSEEEIDLLVDNCVNANFDRIIIERGDHSITVRVSKRFKATDRKLNPRKNAETVAAIARAALDTQFATFAATIWETMLLPGVTWAEATGAHLRQAKGWCSELAKHVRPTEKVIHVLSARDIFNLARRVAA